MQGGTKMNNKIKIIAGSAAAAVSLYAANALAQPKITYKPKKPAAAAGTTPGVAPTPTPAPTPAPAGKNCIDPAKHSKDVSTARAQGKQDGFKQGEVAGLAKCPKPSPVQATPQNTNVGSRIKVNDRRSSVRRNVNGCEKYVMSQPQFQNKYGVCATDSGRDALKRLGVSVFNTIPASEYRSLSKRFASCPGESICTVVGTDDMRNVNAMLGGKLSDALRNGNVNEQLMRKIIAEYTLKLKQELSVNMSGAVTPVDLAPEASHVTAGMEFLFNGDGNTLSALTAGYQLSWSHVSAEGKVGYMFLSGKNTKDSSRIVDYDSTKLALGTQILKDVATDTAVQGKHIPFAEFNIGVHYDFTESTRGVLKLGPMITYSDRGTGQSNMYHFHQSANPAISPVETNTESKVATKWVFDTGYTLRVGLDRKVGDNGAISLNAALRCFGTELGDKCYGGLGLGGKF